MANFNKSILLISFNFFKLINDVKINNFTIQKFNLNIFFKTQSFIKYFTVEIITYFTPESNPIAASKDFLIFV